MLKHARLVVPLMAVALFVPAASAFWPFHPCGTHLHHPHATGVAVGTQFAVAPFGAAPYGVAEPQSVTTDLLIAALPTILGIFRDRVSQLPPLPTKPGLNLAGSTDVMAAAVPAEVPPRLKEVDGKLDSTLSKMEKLALEMGTRKAAAPGRND